MESTPPNSPPPSPETRQSPLWARVARSAVALLLGFAIGVFFHYLLYRFSLPQQPFIYVSF
jgi:hypothetical protein